MSKKLLLAVILLLLATNVMSLFGWGNTFEKKVLLENYYQGAEELLDTLENHYGWVDAIDNDAYYDAVDKLK